MAQEQTSKDEARLEILREQGKHPVHQVRRLLIAREW